MGVMFQFSGNNLNISLESFYDKFLYSKISSLLELEDSSILGGK